ncbi:MAG: hypothetical protein CM15mP25_0660 [Gammaproteobacteria bacterium]|nr:MAG: hypothetical protein CM15mP25_0660 [Gammaproteobacteria bacterium]
MSFNSIGRVKGCVMGGPGVDRYNGSSRAILSGLPQSTGEQCRGPLANSAIGL